MERTNFALKFVSNSISSELGTVDSVHLDEVIFKITFVHRPMITQGAGKRGILSTRVFQVIPQTSWVSVCLIATVALIRLILNSLTYD